MSEHTHTSLVDGCFRCDLNRDEIPSLSARIQDALDEWSDEHTTVICDHEHARSQGHLMNECWECRMDFTICAVREAIAAEIEADAVTLCAACRAADGTENRRCNDCASHRHWFARAARLVRRGEQQ